MIRLGLRTRFFLYSNTVIAVTMVLVTVISMVHERRSRYEAIDRRGRSIVEAMAIPITDALLYQDLGLVAESGLIENHITEIIARNRDFMRYVVVTDPTGRVTHSNRWDILGQQFDRVLGPESIGRGSVTEILTDGSDRVLEVCSTLNISTKYWGSIAVGFSLDPIERQVRDLARRAAVVALILMLFNSVVTALYVESLIRPILDLNQTMKRAGTGDLAVRAAARSRDEVGELAGAFNRMMDELEEAREREQVQRAQLTHTEKMVAVGTLAAGVAHEVNNPLAGVLACIENLRADPDDEEMRRRYLDLIEDGLKRIERTITNLLNFARQRELRPEPTSLNHNLRHVVELVGYQLRNAGVQVELDLEPRDTTVMADHFQMEQLFLNLILNAVEAMPGGGTLCLRTRAAKGRVVAEVEDTGRGIPPDIRDRIFDPFFTTRDVGEGTGLGLSVSDTIVRAHGGSIEVHSKLGQGSLFRVVLAAAEPAPGGEGGR
jgi:signal transduction histidine kinase